MMLSHMSDHVKNGVKHERVGSLFRLQVGSSIHYTRNIAPSEWRDPSPRLCAGTTQLLRRDVAVVASYYRHCFEFSDPGIEPRPSALMVLEEVRQPLSAKSILTAH